LQASLLAPPGSIGEAKALDDEEPVDKKGLIFSFLAILLSIPALVGA